MAQKDAQVNIKLSQTSATLATASKKDSEVMRSIAVETQKDSFAMKTIAVLGMFFLPGTFVAVSPHLRRIKEIALSAEGRFRDASIQLGRQRYAGHQIWFQILLACYRTIDCRCADVVGSGHGTAVEDLGVENLVKTPILCRDWLNEDSGDY